MNDRSVRAVFSCDSWKKHSNNIQIDLFYFHGLIPFAERVRWIAAGCSDTTSAVPTVDCDDLLNNITNDIAPPPPPPAATRSPHRAAHWQL